MSSTTPTFPTSVGPIPLKFCYLRHDSTSSDPEYVIFPDLKHPSTRAFTSTPGYSQTEFDSNIEVIEAQLPAAVAANKDTGISEERVVALGIALVLERLRTTFEVPGAAMTVDTRRVEWTEEQEEHITRMIQQEDELSAALQTSQKVLIVLTAIIKELSKKKKWQKVFENLYDDEMGDSAPTEGTIVPGATTSGGTAHTEEPNQLSSGPGKTCPEGLAELPEKGPASITARSEAAAVRRLVIKDIFAKLYD